MQYKSDNIIFEPDFTLEGIKDQFNLEKELIDYEISDFDTFEQYVDYFWTNFSHDICDVTLK